MPQYILDDNGNRIIDDNGNPKTLESSTTTTQPAQSGKWVKRGFTTQWEADKPTDLNNRVDQSMFDIPESSRNTWRNSITDAIGMSTLPDSMKGPIATGAGFIGAEVPFGILDAFKSPESVAVPSMVKGIGKGLLTKTPKAGPAQKLLPATASPDFQMPPASIQPELSSINAPPTANRMKSIRGQRGQFTQEEVLQQPDKSLLGVNSRKVYNEKGEVIPQGAGKIVTIKEPEAPVNVNPMTGEELPITPNSPVRPQFVNPKLAKAQSLLQGLVKNEEGSLNLGKIKSAFQGLMKDESGSTGRNVPKLILNELNQAVTKGGRLDAAELFSRYSSEIDEDAFTKVIEDFVSSKMPKKPGEITIGPMPAEVTPEGTKLSVNIMDKHKNNITETMNLPRALQSSWDLSFPFRQGLGAITKKAWWGSWDEMIRAYGGENAFRISQQAIKERPLFKNVISPEGKLVKPSYADTVGLDITDLNNLDHREEQIMSTWAETGGNIPYFSSTYGKTMGSMVRRSNRAYTAFGNQLRADMFEEMIKNADRLGLNPQTDLALGRDIAKAVNSFSGRGSLGAMEKHAQLLNSAFFSPRLISSRMRSIKDGLNYKNYQNALAGDPKAKMLAQESLRSVWGMIGTWTALAGAAKLGGAEVNTSLTSSDFGKIKIGNTRLDPAGGLQQYLVLAAKNSPIGGSTSSINGKFTEFGSTAMADTRGSTNARFIGNKTSPWISLAIDFMMANKERPFPVGDQAARMVIPMVVQDMIDVAREDPGLIPLALPSIVGLGTQTYGEKTKEERRNPGMFGENDIQFQGGGLF